MLRIEKQESTVTTVDLYFYYQALKISLLPLLYILAVEEKKLEPNLQQIIPLISEIYLDIDILELLLSRNEVLELNGNPYFFKDLKASIQALQALLAMKTGCQKNHFFNQN